MKSQSIYSSLLLCILTFSHFLTIAAERCVDFPDPLNLSKQVIVDCPPTANKDVYVKRQTTNFFEVTHNCSATAALCNNIKEAFNDAGKEISKVLKLKQIIKVNATFTDLFDPTLLGAAGSARYLPLTSDDKIIRLYPQPLVKQFSLSVHPEYDDYDIIAFFNTGVDWWFKTDNETIGSDQHDFYLIILHKLIHGLGFISSWSNLLETVVDQDITGLTPIPDFGVSTSIDYTSQLNESVSVETSFDTNLEFITQVKSSSQWEIAESAFISATTNDSSGINHVSEKHYDLTPNFLMTWSQASGETLEYAIQRGGNYSSPIGPRILSILESIGY
ncbi:1206_t:CDS:2 [Diversispora eburnea]|uniref:1206_t:CDS:1 n=1 Tax=Diversispora eburnea TaxID=1213867 RepID=A0A9N9C105_9GLOM|nr:1206_t:CDS:2 [Diversispora eburnea]